MKFALLSKNHRNSSTWNHTLSRIILDIQIKLSKILQNFLEFSQLDFSKVQKQYTLPSTLTIFFSKKKLKDNRCKPHFRNELRSTRTSDLDLWRCVNHLRNWITSRTWCWNTAWELNCTRSWKWKRTNGGRRRSISHLWAKRDKESPLT